MDLDSYDNERREGSSHASTSGRSTVGQAFIDLGIDDRITVRACNAKCTHSGRNVFKLEIAPAWSALRGKYSYESRLEGALC